MPKNGAQSTHDSSSYFKIQNYVMFMQVFWKKAVTLLDKKPSL